MAASRIETPTPFAEWVKTKALFDDDATMTETRVTDGHEPGTRYAYGKSSEGWCFYIAMTPDEEHVFWAAYRAWVQRGRCAELHMAIVSTGKPPNCGTPDTPPCPDLVDGHGGPLALQLTSASGGEKAA